MNPEQTLTHLMQHLDHLAVNMETTKQELADSFQQLAAQLVTLNSTNTTHQSPTATQKDPKTDPPEPFGGNRRDYLVWKDKLENFFELQPFTFPTDKLKISFIYTRMNSFAAKWFKTLRNDPSSKTLLSSWVLFWNAADTRFLDPNMKENARDKLERIAQEPGQAASIYAIKFQETAVDCDYDDAYLIRCFSKGLQAATLTRMANLLLVPSTFPEFVKKAIEEDDREYNLQQLLGNRRNNNARGTRQRTSSDIGRTPRFKRDNDFHPDTVPTPRQAEPINPQPMDLDLITVPRQPLTKDEKDRRMRLGLCLYCGDKGHLANQCPAKGRRVTLGNEGVQVQLRN